MNTISTADVTLRQTSARPCYWRRGLVAWLPLLVLPVAVYALTAQRVTPWQLMWLLSAAVYVSFKWLAWQSVRLPPASAARKAAWWLGWMGMDPAKFLRDGSPAAKQQPTAEEWIYAAWNILAGSALLILGIKLIAVGWLYAAGWCGMFGVVLVLHFGLFHVISCAWRAGGINALPIMDRPLRSVSLGEFWGRRWNRAFRDASYAALFQPIAKRWSGTAAMIAVFLVSGIIHEIGISTPAGSGYGLPTLYFALQALMLLLENSPLGKRAGLGRGLRGRLFAMLTVFGPLAMLFHPPFVNNVIVPMLKTLL